MSFSLDEKKEIFLKFSDIRQIPSNHLMLNGIEKVLSESELNDNVFEFARSQSSWFSEEMIRPENASISQPIPSAIEVLSLRVYDGSFNAHSLKWSEGKYLTIVNQGYIDLCKAISYSSSKILLRISQKNSNPVDDIARHLKEYLKNDGRSVSLPKVSITDSNLFEIFSQAVNFFNNNMLMYILLHEYAHILFGHCDHYNDVQSGTEKKLRWEFLSDHFAAYLLSDGVLRSNPELLFFAKPSMYLNFVIVHCIERHMNKNGDSYISHPDVLSRVSTATKMMNFVYDVTLPNIGLENKTIELIRKKEDKIMNDFSESFGNEGQIIDQIIDTLK